MTPIYHYPHSKNQYTLHLLINKTFEVNEREKRKNNLLILKGRKTSSTTVTPSLPRMRKKKHGQRKKKDKNKQIRPHFPKSQQRLAETPAL